MAYSALPGDDPASRPPGAPARQPTELERRLHKWKSGLGDLVVPVEDYGGAAAAAASGGRYGGGGPPPPSGRPRRGASPTPSAAVSVASSTQRRLGADDGSSGWAAAMWLKYDGDLRKLESTVGADANAVEATRKRAQRFQDMNVQRAAKEDAEAAKLAAAEAAAPALAAEQERRAAAAAVDFSVQTPMLRRRVVPPDPVDTAPAAAAAAGGDETPPRDSSPPPPAGGEAGGTKKKQSIRGSIFAMNKKRAKGQGGMMGAVEALVTSPEAITSLAVFLGGLLSMFVYASFVIKHFEVDATQTFFMAVLPTFSMMVTVYIKLYYDLVPGAVGHFDKMYLIIRSRLWIFPGLFLQAEVKRAMAMVGRASKYKDVWDNFKRKAAPDPDAERERALAGGVPGSPLKKSAPPPDAMHEFAFDKYVSMAKFEEYRYYARTHQTSVREWSKALKPTFDPKVADLLADQAMKDIFKLFPFMEALDLTTSPYKFGDAKRVKAVMRRVNRGIKSAAKAAAKIVAQIDETDEAEYAGDTDIGENHPWGKHMIPNARLHYLKIKNEFRLSATLIFVLCMGGTLMMIATEIMFEAKAKPKDVGAHESAVAADLGIIDLVFLIPYGFQCAGLITQNVTIPMLIMRLITLHIDQYMAELGEVFQRLALRKGKMEHISIDPKRRMVRDLLTVQHMKKFYAQIEAEASCINSSIGLLVLQFLCHFVPLVYSLSNHGFCVPYWLAWQNLVIGGALAYLVWMAAGINDYLESQLNDFLRSWRLKLAMSIWTGGWVDDGDEEMPAIGFIPFDEEAANLRMASTDPADTMFKLQQLKIADQVRMNGLIKVIKEFENEETTPFCILGFPITRGHIITAFALGGGTLVGALVDLFKYPETFVPGMFCHQMCHHASAAALPEPFTPTALPSAWPTGYPTYEPTPAPSMLPTGYPTYDPTLTPTPRPTTPKPTNKPSPKPSRMTRPEPERRRAEEGS